MLINGCQKEEYTFGDLTPPTNLTIETTIIGQDAQNPNGDGSGLVKIVAHAGNAITYHISYDSSLSPEFSSLPSGIVTKKFTSTGVNEYTITVKAFGKGGTTTVMSKVISVRSDFTPQEYIITDLTNNASKTWIVDKDVPGHFGVGPWSNASRTPEWWSAGINEKVACCNCFYTTKFTFTKSGNNYTLLVENPDGAFTKTGSLTNLPGIPASGDEGCYPYAGGTGAISFIPTDVVFANSTNTQIQLSNNTIYIGYGSLQNTFEIVEITPDYMYLRAQGTEIGNAWYLKLKPLQ